MSTTYSYACADCEGMEACPAQFTAETQEELWQLMGPHASIAHDEDPSAWTDDVTAYLKTLIKIQPGS
jgi:hypothetical protein